MKTPKMSLLLALATGALLAFSPALRAQDDKAPKDAPKDAPKREGKGGAEFMKQQLDRMTESLKLTDDQKKKVEEAMKARGEKMRALRDATPEERKEKGPALREEFDKKMKEILTKEQYEKFEKEREQRGPGGPGGPGNGEGKKKKKSENN